MSDPRRRAGGQDKPSRAAGKKPTNLQQDSEVHLNWYDVQCFVVVARTGSVREAANALNQDRGVITRRINDLQASLGVQLFTGVTKNFGLTAQGVRLLQDLAPMEETIDRVLSAVLPLSGLVTITAAPVTAIHALAPTLPQLKKQHPELRVILKSLPDRAHLERGEADISIGTVKPPSEAAVVREVGEVRYDIYCGAETSTRPEDEWSFVAADRDYDHLPFQEWLIDQAGARECVFQTHDVIVQLEAVAAGIGVAVLPCLVADRNQRVRRLGWSKQPPSRPMYISSFQKVGEGSTIQKVMDHCDRVVAAELARTRLDD